MKEETKYLRGIQDYFADAQFIVDLKFTNEQRNIYIFNNYLGLGVTVDSGDADSVMFQKYYDIIYSHKIVQEQINKTNYFQWCKIQHNRADWKNKFPEWRDAYKMWKLDKLFSK